MVETKISKKKTYLGGPSRSRHQHLSKLAWVDMARSALKAPRESSCFMEIQIQTGLLYVISDTENDLMHLSIIGKNTSVDLAQNSPHAVLNAPNEISEGTFLVPNGSLQVRKFTAGKAQERIQFKSIHANHVFLSHHDNYNNS